MGKFEGMLFCTDLDGTLYTDEKTVSKENLDAIEYFKSEGGLFTFITGRASYTSKDVYDIIKPNAPYGCFNGAAIFDGANNQYIWKTLLPAVAQELVDAVEKQMPEIGIQINTDNGLYFYKDNPAMQLFRKLTGTENVYARYEDVKDSVVKVLFAHTENEQIEALGRFLNNHSKASEFDFIRSEHILYEILPKGVSKGNALLKMAELLNIGIKKTIAVGDYNNDVSMIKSAGAGFAVANAVSEAKAAADYITVSNEEHAIAAIVDGLDKGMYL